MNLSMIFSAVIFLGAVLISQKLAVNAAARLDDETKLQIMHIFPKRNLNYTIAVYSVLIIFFIGLYAFPERAFILWLAYIAIFAFYFIFKFVRNIKTLTRIGAPEPYLKSIFASYLIFTIGAVSAFLVLLVSGFGQS